MDTFAQGLEITAVGMVLVFLSLVIVAVLIWSLDRIFRPPQAAVATAAPVPAGTRVVPAVAEPAAAGVERLENEAAAIAVALARLQQGVASRRSGLDLPVRARVLMPWERALESPQEGEREADTVTILAVSSRSANWRRKGRLEVMD